MAERMQWLQFKNVGPLLPLVQSGARCLEYAFTSPASVEKSFREAIDTEPSVIAHQRVIEEMGEPMPVDWWNDCVMYFTCTKGEILREGIIRNLSIHPAASLALLRPHPPNLQRPPQPSVVMIQVSRVLYNAEAMSASK